MLGKVLTLCEGGGAGEAQFPRGSGTVGGHFYQLFLVCGDREK